MNKFANELLKIAKELTSKRVDMLKLTNVGADKHLKNDFKEILNHFGVMRDFIEMYQDGKADSSDVKNAVFNVTDVIDDTVRNLNQVSSSLGRVMNEVDKEEIKREKELKRLKETERFEGLSDDVQQQEVLDYLLGKTSSKNITAMNESRFWKFVDTIGWGRKTVDYDKVKKYLIKALPKEEAEDMSDILSRKRQVLANRIEKWESEFELSCGVGDDGFRDLCNHIIGLGKKEYDKVINNPSLAYSRATDGNYEESFSYCIPFSSDYGGIEGLQKRAVRSMRKYKSYLRDKNYDTSRDEKVIKMIIKALDKMRKGDVMGFLKTEKVIVRLVDELYDGKTDWGIKNLYSDVKRIFK